MLVAFGRSFVKASESDVVDGSMAVGIAADGVISARAVMSGDVGIEVVKLS